MFNLSSGREPFLLRQSITILLFLFTFSAIYSIYPLICDRLLGIRRRHVNVLAANEFVVRTNKEKRSVEEEEEKEERKRYFHAHSTIAAHIAYHIVIYSS